MYKSDFCQVDYIENKNVVLVSWKKYCSHNDYRKPLQHAIEIMNKHKSCNYAADTRNGFENHPDDTQWVADYFFPKAAEAGCRYIYFIIDKENSLRNELEGQENLSSGLAFRYIYSIDEIAEVR